ncbi:unnamed protein product, partial [Arabidopsis halleri]
FSANHHLLLLPILNEANSHQSNHLNHQGTKSSSSTTRRPHPPLKRPPLQPYRHPLPLGVGIAISWQICGCSFDFVTGNV